ncbi:PQQ-binding-like beta-propeller repeat protein [Streptomyces sp. VRA16 Mangrove soil]|uniref:outer membrane protein assembly factor BamB family protein n=1 Tax=Streptomyces sp. VRA16 Mangrove soil TaxID=2817434 RepID=UPI001A9D6294|nr:PQQ-binding-like beta-propeller repeat protein [Streptomyces sp. VRA16 Mangrove soil]MBO1338079.1 PQQ-binding-like beta-propeller repeat protein [Streptomyces sp. VRA16 Mangrove soil]
MPPGPPPGVPPQAPAPAPALGGFGAPAPQQGQPAYPVYGQPPQPSQPQQPLPQYGGGGWGGPNPQPPGSGGAGKAIGITVAVVAALALVGGGLFVVNKLTMHDSSSSSAGDELPSDALDLAWDTDLAKTDDSYSSAGQNGMPNFQLVKDNLIVGDKTGVRAYNPDDGKLKWELKAPKGAGEPCAISREGSSRGLLGVVFDAGGDDCSIVSVVDVDNGKITWSKKLTGKYNTFASQAEIAINDHTLTTNVGGTSVISNWKSQGGKGYPLYARSQYCDDGVIFSQSYVVGHSFCDDVSPHNALTVTDVEYGGEKVYSNAQKLEVVRILSDSPLTVQLQDKDEKQYVESFPDDKPGKIFPLTGELAQLQIDDERHTMVADDSVLITGYKDVEGLAGVDLDTGELLWKKTDHYQLAGYDASAKKLYAAQDDPRNALNQRLLTIDPHTGKQQVNGSLAVKGDDSDTVDIGIASTTQYAYDGTNVYLLAPNEDMSKRMLRAFKIRTQ